MTDAPPVIAPASSSGIAGKILRGLAAVLLVLMFTGLHYSGLLYSALFYALFIAVPSAALFKAWSAFRRKLEFGLVRRRFRRGTRRQGGRSALLNHHYLLRQQRHALDLLKVNDGRTLHGDATKVESYAAYGQELLAPADGSVTEVVNDQPDQPIGGSDAQQLTGNRLVIEIAANRFVMLAHLMKGSVSVVKGERVTRGQPVARCGNSGNTSEPHLHLQVQDRTDFWAEDLKTFPILFRNVALVRGGRTQQLQKADVRRNDRIAAQNNRATS